MEMVKHVVFKLGKEEYGMDIADVQSIERYIPSTRLPNAPAYFVGLINLRGTVIPVINLAGRIGLEVSTRTDRTRIVIAAHSGFYIGLVVDETSDVIDVDKADILPSETMGADADWFSGILIREGRLIMLLSLERLVEIKDLEAAG